MAPRQSFEISKIVSTNNIHFQLYLLFNQLQTHSVEDIILSPKDHQKRQMISVAISVLALAISFTVNYRENKENSMGIVSTFVYFVYIIMAVVARTLCFEIYAFYLVSFVTNLI